MTPARESQGSVVVAGRRRCPFPTTDQVAVLLGSLQSRYRTFLALAAFGGLRLGEAAGVQVGDIDFLRRQLAVARQVQRGIGGGVEVRPPKYSSERILFLPDALVSMLAQHVAAHRPGDDPSRWLFEASLGRPPHQNTVGHAWRQACRRGRIVGFTLHDMRHFYAKGLIAAGCDVVTVQRALGHAKAITTLNTYAHLWPTAGADAGSRRSAHVCGWCGLPADRRGHLGL